MLEVLLFGPAAHAAQASRVPVAVVVSPHEHASGPAVRDVLGALGEQHPALRAALSGARLAVNHAFVTPETRVAPGDELALISLVGGG